MAKQAMNKRTFVVNIMFFCFFFFFFEEEFTHFFKANTFYDWLTLIALQFITCVTVKGTVFALYLYSLQCFGQKAEIMVSFPFIHSERDNILSVRNGTVHHYCVLLENLTKSSP